MHPRIDEQQSSIAENELHKEGVPSLAVRFEHDV